MTPRSGRKSLSSIDEKARKELAKFYDKSVIPLAGRPDTMRLEFAAPDSKDTYFVTRVTTKLRKADFELAFGDERLIAQTMERMWRGGPLGGVAKRMLKLKKYFHVTTEQRSDLSSFIYEMF